MQFINTHRQPTDPPAETTVAEIGLAELIFKDAMEPRSEHKPGDRVYCLPDGRITNQPIGEWIGNIPDD